MASVLRDSLIRWKRKLEKDPEESIILNVIHKLSKIPMTVDLLQETGIGKVIRPLAKKPGVVGEKATVVLHNWREVVANAQKCESSSKPKSTSKKESGHKESSSVKSSSKQITNSHENNHNPQKTAPHSDHKHKNHSNGSLKHGLNKTSTKHLNGDKYNDSDAPGNHSSSPYTYDKSDTSAEYIDYDPHSDVNLGYSPDHPELYPVNNKQSSKKDGNSYQTNRYSSTNGESHSGKRKLSESSMSDTDNAVNKKIKTETYQPTAVSSANKVKNEMGKIDRSNTYREKSKEKKSHQDQPSTKKDNGKNQKVPSETKPKVSSESKKSNKDKEQGNKKHSLTKKSKEKLLQTSEAFTASEATFEDCLGFNDIVPIKKKKSAQKSASLSSSNSHKSSASTSKKNEKHTKSPSKSSSEENKKPPKPEKITLPDISFDDFPQSSVKIDKVDIESTLPQIQPNYRPLPQKSADGSLNRKKVMSNEEAIKFTSSRREKTAVYSGRRNCYFSEVPSLSESCIRVLIENIDAIEYMGEVPYFLLKPVLGRCTALQLYTIEHYNPYLLEDTHELWEKHCRRDYRGLEPQENETWRDLYWRAHEEREMRLKSVTANISASMSKFNPGRQVKLAYVDTVVKPPRDVARRQAKHGTGLPVNHTVKAGPPSKATPRPTAPAVNSSSASTSSSSFVPKKPKVAPLMAKTLKSMKQCFRRK